MSQQQVKWKVNGKEVTGTVYATIPAGERPSKASYRSLYRNGEIGPARSHESWVIEANGKLYWPIASRVQFIVTAPKPLPASKPATAKKAKGSQSIIDSYKSDNTQAPTKRIVNHIGFSLDFSVSMRGIAEAARNDFNTTVGSLAIASADQDQDTFITTVQCSYPSTSQNTVVIKNTRVENIPQMAYYGVTGGDTPLYDSVGLLIDTLQNTPVNALDDNAYMVMIITDGGENSSRKYNASTLRRKIEELQATGRWTFVFRVPRGEKRSVENLGVPAGNILEWETTTRGYEVSTKATTQAYASHLNARSAGQTRTVSFYADLSKLSDSQIKGTLTDITKDVWLLPITQTTDIRPFVASHGISFEKGKGFYQLTKSEEVQAYKEFIVQDKRDGKIYGGDDARQLLNLPSVGYIRLRPGDTGNYDVFVQSTSVNRKLLPNTRLIYLK